VKNWTKTLINEVCRSAGEVLIAFLEEEDDLPPEDDEEPDDHPALLEGADD
jgi:hypothetical protein